jgi:alpha-tubulin suppressor-like RCC1 family protein
MELHETLVTFCLSLYRFIDLVFINCVQGEVWTCGSGCFGQLGLDDTSKRSRLTKVTTFKEPVKAVASKLSHSVSKQNGEFQLTLK